MKHRDSQGIVRYEFEKLHRDLGSLGSITLVNRMGDQREICKDARISHNNRESIINPEKDQKLVKYLWKNQHTSPFRGTILKFVVICPLSIARQWWKHVIGANSSTDQLAWNERSYRYQEFDVTADVYLPDEFFTQSRSNKQASDIPLDAFRNEEALKLFRQAATQSALVYQRLIELGVSREDARLILPQSTLTTFVWTASLQAVINFYMLREANSSQHQIREFAVVIGSWLRHMYPDVMSEVM